MATYRNAIVEWALTSEQSTVALRPDGGPVSHYAIFANDKGLIVATCAGIVGKRVDFTTDGERDNYWQNVQITAVG
ncbi:MAG TPA: hypothetical protein VHG91_13600 [Longimicrobium sp.]|nr:hypothetical protein [Longimicrobium sp.]